MHQGHARQQAKKQLEKLVDSVNPELLDFLHLALIELSVAANDTLLLGVSLILALVQINVLLDPHEVPRDQ